MPFIINYVHYTRSMGPFSQLQEIKIHELNELPISNRLLPCWVLFTYIFKSTPRLHIFVVLIDPVALSH